MMEPPRRLLLNFFTDIKIITNKMKFSLVLICRIEMSVQLYWSIIWIAHYEDLSLVTVLLMLDPKCI